MRKDGLHPRQAFDGADVHYASKAFLCGQVARWIADEQWHPRQQGQWLPDGSYLQDVVALAGDDPVAVVQHLARRQRDALPHLQPGGAAQVDAAGGAVVHRDRRLGLLIHWQSFRNQCLNVCAPPACTGGGAAMFHPGLLEFGPCRALPVGTRSRRRAVHPIN